MAELKDKIRHVRKKLKLNQKNFAGKLGISFAALQNYESGKRTPGVEVIKKIAEIGGVYIDWLLSTDPEDIDDNDKYTGSDSATPAEYDAAYKRTLRTPQTQQLLNLINKLPADKQKDLTETLIKMAELATKE